MAKIMIFQLPLTADEATALNAARRCQLALIDGLAVSLELLRRHAEEAEAGDELRGLIAELISDATKGQEAGRVVYELASRIHYVPPGSKGGTA